MQVNRGDAIWFQTPHGKEVLIDGGDDIRILSELEKYRPFWDRSIDILIITHPDKDHYGGAIEVLKRFDVQNVILTGALKSDPYYNELFRIIQEKNVHMMFAYADTDFIIDGVEFDFLYPFTSQFANSKAADNNYSLVLKVQYNGKKILLTGDAEKEAEEILLQSDLNLSADVLKIGHHGSKTSSTKSFLQAVKPEKAIITTGVKNSFGHPHLEVLERLEEMNIPFENVRDGAVVLEWE